MLSKLTRGGLSSSRAGAVCRQPSTLGAARLPACFSSSASSDEKFERVKAKCTASEALVESLVRHKVDKVFGIVGSAFIDPLDLFPAAGIDFIDVQHEQNAVHMADAYGRLTKNTSVCMGQNGPGISNMVTGVATAFMNHAPVCVITPQSGSDSIGKLGFQELQQLPMFSNITKFQVHVENSVRMAELANRAFDRALQNSGPTQLNYSRNLLNDVHEYDFPVPRGKYNPVVPPDDVLDEILSQLLAAKNPVLLAGYGLEDPAEVQKLAATLNIPVASTYLHNDTYPASDPHAVGSLGYMGSKAAMRCVQESDLVVAIGSRLNPFGTTPQYGMPYWDAEKPLIQIDQNINALAVSCMPSLAVHGDAVATIAAINARLEEVGFDSTGVDRLPYAQYRDEWKAERDNVAGPAADGRLPPKTVLHTLAKVIKERGDCIVTTDIGHCCSQALAYLEFERPGSLFTAGTFGSCGTAIPLGLGARFAEPEAERPVFALVGDGAVNMQGINELLTAGRNKLGITILVFRNEVWGAELLNQLIWTDARAVGTEIETPSIAGIATAYGAHGERVEGSVEALKKALDESVERQKTGQTTLLEVMCTSEMGAPFRSDAMSCPTRHLPKYQHLTTTTADYSRQYKKEE